MQYITELKLTDAERLALEDAIKIYKEFVHNKIGDEIKAPYWARLQSIKKVEDKINRAEINELL